MIQVPQKKNMVSVSVRLAPETLEKVCALAQSLSMEHATVTEGAVLRQIITDFFSSKDLQNVNSEDKK
jgi:predicted DNA-binding protein